MLNITSLQEVCRALPTALPDRPFRTQGKVVEVLRGPLCYPSETGGWQLGDVDLSEYLSKYHDCEVTVIIAATGEAGMKRVFCGVCGFALDDAGGECPRCRLIVEETARQLRSEQDGEALFREVDEILAERDEE